MAKNFAENQESTYTPKPTPGSLDGIQELFNGEAMRRMIGMSVAKGFDPDRLRRLAYIMATKDPKVALCTNESILNALAECAAYQLEPMQGRCYLIPYEETVKGPDGKSIPIKKGTKYPCHKEWRLQFQIGYLGLVELAKRSGHVTGLITGIVRQRDKFEFNIGSVPPFVHCPYIPSFEEELKRCEEVKKEFQPWLEKKKGVWDNDKGTWKTKPQKDAPPPEIAGDKGIIFYVYATFKNSPPSFGYMFRSHIEERRYKFSQAPTSAAWESSFEEMALKTVLKNTMKSWSLSEMQDLSKAIEKDTEETEQFDVIDVEHTVKEQEALRHEKQRAIEAPKPDIFGIGSKKRDDFVTAAMDLEPEEPEKKTRSAAKRESLLSDDIPFPDDTQGDTPDILDKTDPKLFVNLLDLIRSTGTRSALEGIGAFLKECREEKIPNLLDTDYSELATEYNEAKHRIWKQGQAAREYQDEIPY